MIREVLLVDDDREMLLSLREGLEKYGGTFSVKMAGDGVVAVRKLKESPISLVVTDLKMPRMDGFELLAHIMEHYPDIPVIMITAYGTPEIERYANSGGAVGYIEKPFVVEDLAKKILSTIRKESDGGTLHGVSSGMFLQLIEMEQKTCTIRLVDKISDNKGVLFFKDGDLFEARVNDLQGVEAAYEIFSWDEVTLSIQNDCSVKENKINIDLQAVLLEAMRRKDEKGQEAEEESGIEEEEKPPEEIKELEPEDVEEAPEKPVDLRSAIGAQLGKSPGINNEYESNKWDGLLAQIRRIGHYFNAGDLKIVHLDRGESNDIIMVPGEKTKVLSLEPRAPAERILKIVMELF